MIAPLSLIAIQMVTSDKSVFQYRITAVLMVDALEFADVFTEDMGVLVCVFVRCYSESAYYVVSPH